ncbi:MAG TPA: NUDIX hydrolase [Verrucomicrobiae bacterium]|jgi:ADP-ribose pyrophosphatase|nr:NUDIX hydrolase [Verrucomicrobiae bacterium]
MPVKAKFTVKTRKVVFSKGPVHLVDCLVRAGKGKWLSRQILEHPGSVVMIPKISKQRYLLVRQFRFAARGWLWEFPAGGIEPGENLNEAAKRELCEEIGACPKKMRKLVSFYPSPGISSEVMHLFLAEKLYPAWGEKDEDEEIEIGVFTGPQIEAMIRSGKITDAKTILGFYYLTRRR